MSTNLSKVAEDVKSLAKRFQAILAVGEALDEIGSLEQAKKDAIIAKDKAYEAADIARGEMNAAEAALEVAQGKVKAAEKSAGEIIALAHAKSDAIINAANNKAFDIQDAAEKKKNKLDERFADVCRELAHVNAEISGKKNELEDLKNQIASIKSKLQAFVGG